MDRQDEILKQFLSENTENYLVLFNKIDSFIYDIVEDNEDKKSKRIGDMLEKKHLGFMDKYLLNKKNCLSCTAKRSKNQLIDSFGEYSASKCSYIDDIKKAIVNCYETKNNTVLNNLRKELEKFEKVK